MVISCLSFESLRGIPLGAAVFFLLELEIKRYMFVGFALSEVLLGEGRCMWEHLSQ